jgi:hypothetical protein
MIKSIGIDKMDTAMFAVDVFLSLDSVIIVSLDIDVVSRLRSSSLELAAKKLLDLYPSSIEFAYVLK